MRRVLSGNQPTQTSGKDQDANPDELLVVDATPATDHFAQIFDDYWDDVFRYCYYRTGNWHEAEDIASQVFASALMAFPQFRQGSERSWIFSIAHNTVINAYRKRSMQRSTSFDQIPDLITNEPGPEEIALQLERHSMVHDLLQYVTSDQRELLELRLAGLTSLEIATLLDRSHSSVRTAQHRAMETLRDLMKKSIELEIEGSHA
jgi:RNA polymerase sigma-70 factor, ECF subfamily